MLDDTPPVRPRKPYLLRRKALRHILPWMVIIGIFVIWEIVVRVFEIEQFVLPAPSAIFASGWEWREPILVNAWQTFMTTVIGFLLAVLVGLLARSNTPTRARPACLLGLPTAVCICTKRPFLGSLSRKGRGTG